MIVLDVSSFTPTDPRQVPRGLTAGAMPPNRVTIGGFSKHVEASRSISKHLEASRSISKHLDASVHKISRRYLQHKKCVIGIPGLESE